mmetsp:Transcript_31772/g.101780  ORF Transcript_31772/g.101780 Transcript_31772/m.101780 type:complete len:251 (-) Transcript_31772:1280-2032(-)
MQEGRRPPRPREPVLRRRISPPPQAPSSLSYLHSSHCRAGRSRRPQRRQPEPDSRVAGAGARSRNRRSHATAEKLQRGRLRARGASRPDARPGDRRRRPHLSTQRPSRPTPDRRRSPPYFPGSRRRAPSSCDAVFRPLRVDALRPHARAEQSQYLRRNRPETTRRPPRSLRRDVQSHLRHGGFVGADLLAAFFPGGVVGPALLRDLPGPAHRDRRRPPHLHGAPSLRRRDRVLPQRRPPLLPERPLRLRP